jgi:hypothetical protein
VVPVLASVLTIAGLFVMWSLYRVYVLDAVTGTVLHYDSVTDSQVRITFEVVKDGGTPATCVLRARARDGSEVGRATVSVPAGPVDQKSVVVTHVLPTTGRPLTGELAGCAPIR